MKIALVLSTFLLYASVMAVPVPSPEPASVDGAILKARSPEATVTQNIKRDEVVPVEPTDSFLVKDHSVVQSTD